MAARKMKIEDEKEKAHIQKIIQSFKRLEKNEEFIELISEIQKEMEAKIKTLTVSKDVKDIFTIQGYLSALESFGVK
ncbi:MAG: hypothetical protein KGI50_08170, partial [Patescibacteria group bacterium]|nr:hypothetical protein [Patescibacteria group bacterium]